MVHFARICFLSDSVYFLTENWKVDDVDPIFGINFEGAPFLGKTSIGALFWLKILVSALSETKVAMKVLSQRLGLGKGGVRMAPEEAFGDVFQVPLGCGTPFALVNESASSFNCWGGQILEISWEKSCICGS